jgi:hypothetical protein
MSAQPPPEPPPPSQSYGRPYYGPPMPMPNLNGEFVYFLLLWVVVLIVTLATDEVNWNDFVRATVFLGVGYLLSRGIAKASRVYEGR